MLPGAMVFPIPSRSCCLPCVGNGSRRVRRVDIRSLQEVGEFPTFEIYRMYSMESEFT